MQLEHAIIALWVLSSMLACWFFSLIVRWFSDGRARRLERLKSQYSARSKLIAGVLMVVCLAGSITAGFGADLLSRTGMVGSVRLSSMGAIGMGMFFFSLFLIVWAFVGDRSRGRLRCPRCWYDMSDSEGRPCPECGKEISEPRQLTRTRRPKWAFVVAAIFLVVGGAGLGFNSKFRSGGVAAFIPSGVLLSMWDRVPESWIYDNGIGREQNNLTDRIAAGRINETQRRAFTESLIDRMIQDPMMRWDDRAMTLIHILLRVEVYRFEAGSTDIWAPSNDQLGQLYRACIEDLIAYQNIEEQPFDDPELEMQIAGAFLAKTRMTHTSVRLWLLADQLGVPDYWISYDRNYTPEQINVLRGALGDPLLDEIRTTLSVDAYIDQNWEDYVLQMQIETESGVLQERLPVLLDAYEADPDATNSRFLDVLQSAARTAPDQAPWVDRMCVWIEDGDLDLRLGALNIIGSSQGFSYRAPRAENTPVHLRLIEQIKEHTLDDDRIKKYTYRSDRVSDVAIATLRQIDASGAHAFPLVRHQLETLVDGERLPENMEFELNGATEERLHNWVETFEPLIDHPNRDIRLWVCRSIPRDRGSASVDRLDAMTRTLREDEDPIVMDEAWVKAMNRGVQ